MKSIQIIEEGKVLVIEREIPIIKEDEVLVKVKYVGFCGSDLNTFLGKNPMVKLPVTPGHEIGGIIEEVGSDVPNHFKAGMACTVNPYTSCGECSSCRNGSVNACEFNRTMGVQRDGAMAEYIAIPYNKLLTDDIISVRDFALVEPMSVGFHAVSRAEVTDLDFVMVLGCGMIGVGAIVRAALRGAKVIAVDIDDKKLVLAKKLGASFTINSRTNDLHEEILKITGGFGADVVIEAVGSPLTYVAAINEVAFSGRVVYIGYAKNEVSFQTKLFVQKELDIRGSRNALPSDFKAVMEYMKRQRCPVDELISAIYPPEKAQEALVSWAANPGEIFRILIEF
ncbi:MAG TPA: zinc-binding alcohol dehydrogenase family protein [Niabella sp.]|nr:zinc-binding alcohol dehydrogenase family protein [Chitinophagaceae bacterium]HRO85196.1 zinc-binding alcohol dehydrogenase family protein [Niabella sp.]